jgi:hypothetical protein
MPDGEEGLAHLLVGSRSAREAEARDDARRICGHEQTEPLLPSPRLLDHSDVGESGQPPLTAALRESRTGIAELCPGLGRDREL